VVHMHPKQPWSLQFARFAVATAGLLLLLAIVNIFVNTERIGSWLPLLILMPMPLYIGIWSLRNQAKP